MRSDYRRHYYFCEPFSILDRTLHLLQMASGQDDAARINLDLTDLYYQLHQQAKINARDPPIISTPSVTTQASISKTLSDQLANDDSSVFLRDSRMKERQRRLRKHFQTEANNFSKAMEESSTRVKGNIMPILRDENLPPCPTPGRLTSRSKAYLRQSLQEAVDKDILNKDPYVTALHPSVSEASLPLLYANVSLEAMDVEESDLSAQGSLDNIRVLWDTGAHITIITEDILPKAFLEHIRGPAYSLYQQPKGYAIQTAITLQLSNCNRRFETIAMVRSVDSVPNGFSGIIAGQHSLLNTIEYRVVPCRVLEEKGIDANGYWGKIRLLSHVDIDGFHEL